MDQSANSPLPLRALPSRNEFDEEAYLQLYPDIATGVASGAIESGWWHFSRHGFGEGRTWLAQVDPFAGVSREISPQDEMFSGNETHYFEVGASALHCIESALFTAHRNKATVKKILDLPCGHGRALRFLKKAFPDAQLTACDLNRDGVDYCAKTFGAIPVYSDADVLQIPLHDTFDLIWCGSLLTHLPQDKCADFLRFFQRLLGRNGILVVTLHGRYYDRELTAGRNPHGLTQQQVDGLLDEYRKHGFSYVDYAAGSAYGFSLSHPSFVTASLIDDPAWRLLCYHETGWDKRQDVVSLQKKTSG